MRPARNRCLPVPILLVIVGHVFQSLGFLVRQNFGLFDAFVGGNLLGDERTGGVEGVFDVGNGIAIFDFFNTIVGFNDADFNEFVESRKDLAPRCPATDL